MANEEQLSILRQGVDVWNMWRKKNPDVKIDLRDASLDNLDLGEVDFSKADLRGANLYGCDLFLAQMAGADLSGADINDAKLIGSALTGAQLVGAQLFGANLKEANLSGANLSGAELTGVGLTKVNLTEANLTGANLMHAFLLEADLSRSNLTNANLSVAQFVRTKITMAKISGSSVYGVNVWDLEGEFEEQRDLIITREGQPKITVDNIKVAQFLYLILKNEEIRDVLDTVTTKAVLILGRFYEERKHVLDTLKEALRIRDFVPILFDFEPSKQRDLTETIQLLANMAKFVIADITDAKSIPQELSHIIPFLPSVPVQPILLVTEKEYAMFEHWRSFKSVLPEFLYRDQQDLLDNLEAKILQPIDTWRKDQDEISVLKERIKELEAKKR